MLRIVAIVIACVCAGALPVYADETTPEESGRFAAEESELPFSAKWQRAQRRIADDESRLAACRAEPRICGKDEARLEAIIEAGRMRDGRARIGTINRAINLAIRPRSDRQHYGVADHWSGPLETIGDGAGDCEDYAILKLLALREAGIAAHDLRLLIVRDRAARAYHAVAAVRFEERWLILDNRRFAMVDLEVTHYRVVAQFDEADGMRIAGAETVAPVAGDDIM